MVRRNLRLWIGLALFVALVATLSVIALGQEPAPSLQGRWILSTIETPEGAYGVEGGRPWIEFDGESFRGQMDCLEFEGTMAIPSPGVIRFEEWSSGGPCNQFEDIDQAFDQYFSILSVYRFGEDGLILESSDASVRFSYLPEGA